MAAKKVPNSIHVFQFVLKKRVAHELPITVIPDVTQVRGGPKAGAKVRPKVEPKVGQKVGPNVGPNVELKVGLKGGPEVTSSYFWSTFRSNQKNFRSKAEKIRSTPIENSVHARRIFGPNREKFRSKTR